MAGTEKKFTCKECYAEFDTRDDLRKHIYDEHISDDDPRKVSFKGPSKDNSPTEPHR